MMLTDLAAACRKSGLKVREVDGWRHRGHDEFYSLDTIECHHTAGPDSGNYPSFNTVLHGRPGLDGPLAQLGLARDGTVIVFAAGVAWHAGATTRTEYNNWHALGIEAEHDGVSPWPKPQVDAYARLVAALAEHYSIDQLHVRGHKEVCDPPGRKIDPNFSMSAFRRKVWGYRKQVRNGGIQGGVTVRKPRYWRNHYPPKGTFYVGNHTSASTWLGRRLIKHSYGGYYNVGAGPNYSKTDQKALVAFKRDHGFKANGAMTRPVWEALNRRAGHARAPKFWRNHTPPEGTFYVGNDHTAVTHMYRRLHVHGHTHASKGPKYGKADQRALVAFKRAHRLGSNGEVTPKVWRALNREPSRAHPKPWGWKVNRALVNRALRNEGVHTGEPVTKQLGTVARHLRKHSVWSVKGWPPHQNSVGRALANFQDANGIDVSGLLDKETAKRLGIRDFYKQVPVSPKHRRDTPNLTKSLGYLRDALAYAREAGNTKQAADLQDVNQKLTRVRKRIRNRRY